MTEVTIDLPATTANGRARAQALAETHLEAAVPTSLVSYLSRGRVLVIGAEGAALEAAASLPDSLSCCIMVPGGTAPETGVSGGFRLIRGGAPLLHGALGRFTLDIAEAAAGQAPLDPGLLEHDLVLDLQQPPLLDYEVPPPGYYAPRGDAGRLARALAELPEMTGEFEKPKYFRYKAEICAHGRSGKTGCTRCLDACPTVAIRSLGDRVEVDPYLCQGGGSCVAACPSGAMTYAYPQVSDLLTHIQGLLESYRAAGGTDPVLVFHDAWSRGELLERLGPDMPERILPVQLEETASIGMDAWLACLAFGAAGVQVVVTGGTPPRMVAELQAQLSFVRPILEGMGYDPSAISLLAIDQENAAEMLQHGSPAQGIARPARFTPQEDKRTTLRNAINHLHSQASSPKRTVALPQGAPFGEIKVNKQACTLCMGCVAVCPVSALRDGRDLPQLKFVEWDCVQCGLCEQVCPESAISRNPRFLFDQEARQQVRMLHEEQPFCCIVCGKPFATQSMLKVMGKKLEGHWMFQSEEARRRLHMCDTCRVKDMFQTERGRQ